MSASRLISLLGASILHTRPTLSPPPPRPFLSNRLFKTLTLRSSYCSSAAAVDDSVETLSTVSEPRPHPWPEWVAFVDSLKAKGYFTGDSTPAPEEDGNVYKEMNVVKDVALSFARDRYDIFRALSKEDIQRVVECGCPNLLRKAVNSGKRLRAYLQLDEGNVCSSCNLRGSCDRAYVVLKEQEGARTVDIMRILLLFALDPLVISSGEMPPGRALVPAAARNLLSELIALSDKPPDPALQILAASVPQKKERSPYVDDKYSKDVEMKRGDWMCPKCDFLNFAKNRQCLKCKEDGPTAVGSAYVETKKGDWVCPECTFQNFARNIKCLKCKAQGPKRVDSDVEMKEGDWNCPKCDFLNFAKNRRCLKCKEDGPTAVGSGFVEMKKGDWVCPECAFQNFARNIKCLKCKAQGPLRVDSDVEMKEGDWNCPQCGFMNFSSKKACFRCREARPKRVLKPGEWECPSCDFLNYRKNMICLKCDCKRPKDVATDYEEQMWRGPI